MNKIEPDYPVHQSYFECECGEEGYTQTKGEVKYCSSCGSLIEDVDLIEFTIYEGEGKPEPLVKQHSPRRTSTGQRTGNRHHAPTGHPTPETTVVTRTITDEAVTYSIDCGYSGNRVSMPAHLQRWHGMTKKEAHEKLKVANVTNVDNRTPESPPCTMGEPVCCQVVSTDRDKTQILRYTVRVKGCGFEGRQISVRGHLIYHHKMSLEEARRMVRIGNCERLDDPPTLRRRNAVCYCPVCGKELNAPSALATHIKHRHPSKWEGTLEKTYKSLNQ